MSRASQLALQRDWEVAVGDDWSDSFRFTDGDGVGIDISGESFTAQILAADGTELEVLAQATSAHADDAPGVESILTVSTLDIALPPSVLYRWLVRTSTLADRGLFGGAFMVRPIGHTRRASSPSQPATVVIGSNVVVTMDIGAVGATGPAGSGEGGAVDSVNGATGVVVLDPDDLDDTATVHKFATAAQLAKVDHLTVTQPVDLDQLELDVAALANGMVYAGEWDASAGTFPTGANTGAFYLVSVGGTVDGVTFVAQDRLIAIVDAASTTVYAGNWSHLDATDAVTSVAGLTGNIAATGLRSALNVEDGADVTDTTNVTAAGALMDSEVANLDDVKAFDPADYATAAQGDVADAALPRAAGGASVENVGAIEENVEVANVTGTKAMDLATYGRAVYTMTGDTTFSLTNPAPSGKASTFVMRVKGAFTPTLPASWDFIGTPPAYVGAGEGTSYVGTSEDGGTSYQVTVLAGWA